MHVETMHGAAGFPLELYYNEGTAVGDAGGRFVYTHFHPHLEFLLVLQGEVEMEIDIRRFTGLPGDVFVVNSGRMHAVSAVRGHVCRTLSVVFDLRMLFGPKGDWGTERYLAPLLAGGLAFEERPGAGTPEGRRLRRLLLGIARAHRDKRPGFELQLKAQLLQSLHTLLAGERFSRPRGAQPLHGEQIERIKRVLDHMDAHLAERLPVRELAALIHVSEAHFHAFFRAMTGQSPVEYLNGLRLDRACGMLLTQRLTVRETAMRLGFGNVSYFIRRFKRRYGVTPAVYAGESGRAVRPGLQANSDKSSP